MRVADVQLISCMKKAEKKKQTMKRKAPRCYARCFLDCRVFRHMTCVHGIHLRRSSWPDEALETCTIIN